MNKKKAVGIIIILSLLSFVLPFFIYAETITLKSGKAIEGKIIEKTNQYVKIDFYGITLTYFYDEIDSIDSSTVRNSKDFFASFTPTQVASSIYRILIDLGYSEIKSKEISSLLLPLSSRFNFRDIKNINMLKEDLMESIEVIYNDIYNESNLNHPKHLRIFSSIFPEEVTKIIQNELTISYLGNIELAKLRSLLDCNYISYIASIILKAKGLNVRLIEVLKPREIDRGLFSYWNRESRQISARKHSSCLINLGNEYLIADFAFKFITDPFELEDTYEPYSEDNRYLKLRANIKRDDLYKEIYLSDIPIGKSTLYLDVACIYANNNELDKSIEFIEKSIYQDPNDAVGYYSLSVIYQRKGEYAKAIEYARKAISCDPHQIDAYNSLGVTYSMMRNYDKAEEYFKKAIELDEKNALTYFNAGSLYEEEGNYDKGIEYYQKALLFDPNFAPAHNNLAVAYYNKGQFDLAVEHCSKAVELGLKVAPGFLKLLEPYITKQSSLSKVFSKDMQGTSVTGSPPELNQENYFLREGTKYYSQGDYYQAINYFRKAIEINPSSFKAYSNLCASYSSLGEYQEALKCCKKAIEINPNFVDAYVNIGDAYHSLAQYNESIMYLQKAIEIDPSFAEAYVNLGATYERLGKNQEAIGCYQKAIEIDPKLYEAYVNLGSAYDYSGQYQLAISSLQKALQINPNFATAYCALGNVYINLKKFNEAITYYKKAIEINPKDAQAYNGLGWAYNSSEQFEQAITYFKKALEIENIAESYSGLGYAQYYLGRYTEAKFNLNKAKELFISRGDYQKVKDIEDYLKNLN